MFRATHCCRCGDDDDAREQPGPVVDLRTEVSPRQEDTPLRKISTKTNQSAEAPLRSGRFALPKNELAAFRLRVNCQFDWKRRIISFPALLPSRGIGLHRSEEHTSALQSL